MCASVALKNTSMPVPKCDSLVSLVLVVAIAACAGARAHRGTPARVPRRGGSSTSIPADPRPRGLRRVGPRAAPRGRPWRPLPSRRPRSPPRPRPHRLRRRHRPSRPTGRTRKAPRRRDRRRRWSSRTTPWRRRWGPTCWPPAETRSTRQWPRRSRSRSRFRTAGNIGGGGVPRRAGRRQGRTRLRLSRGRPICARTRRASVPPRARRQEDDGRLPRGLALGGRPGEHRRPLGGVARARLEEGVVGRPARAGHSPSPDQGFVVDAASREDHARSAHSPAFCVKDPASTALFLERVRPLVVGTTRAIPEPAERCSGASLRRCGAGGGSTRGPWPRRSLAPRRPAEASCRSKT